MMPRLACLSDQPRLLYDYFKQTFAQVTNPPLDSDKEYIVMSLEAYIGPERNLLEASPENCHRLLLPQPVLLNTELARIKELNHRGWKTKTIDIVFPHGCRRRATAMTAALARICNEATQAIADGYSLIVLSDRKVDAEHVADAGSCWRLGAVHHRLVAQ